MAYLVNAAFYDQWKRMLVSVDYPKAFMLSSGVSIKTKNKIMNKKNFPIGAEVYVKDNTDAVNLATGSNDLLAGNWQNKPEVCVVMSMPFKALYKNLFDHTSHEMEYILVRKRTGTEIHKVLNDLTAVPVKVALNVSYTAEIDHHTKTVKVGCQVFSFDKVRELVVAIDDGEILINRQKFKDALTATDTAKNMASEIKPPQKSKPCKAYMPIMNDELDEDQETLRRGDIWVVSQFDFSQIGIAKLLKFADMANRAFPYVEISENLDGLILLSLIAWQIQNDQETRTSWRS